jgi:hypothetical protein
MVLPIFTLIISFFSILMFFLFPVFLIYILFTFWGVPLFIIILILSIIFFQIIIMWKACENTAEQVNFLSGSQSLIIFLELIGLTLVTFFNIIFSPTMQSQFLNLTSSLKIKDFIITDPTGGISVLIGIISIITVYLYFFTVFGKSKYFSERSQLQEKYFDIFWRAPFFILIGGSLILIAEVIITKTGNIFDGSLFLIGMINLGSSIPLAYKLKKYFYNTNLVDSEGLKLGDFDYKFLENFQKLKAPFLEKSTPDSILIMTILWAGLALFFNCNIFLLLFTEYCLLVAHFWSSQLSLIPQKKTTIELLDTDCFGNYHKINDVFILADSSKGYIIILDKENQTSSIMKNSIHRLIDQK